MNKTTIAIYLGNKDIENADFSYVELGNPGVGYSEFFPVALTYYLSRDHFGDFDYVLLAQNIKKMPETIACVQVADIVDAAQKAKKMGAEVFVFRTRMKEEQGILDVIERLELKSIGVAQLTPFPDHIDKLSQTKYLRALVCVGREQYDSLLDTKIINKLAVINNAVDINCYPVYPLEERDPKLVVYMGALTYQKGFHMLAMAWPSVIESVPDARLYVIGSTKMYGESRPVGRFGVSDPDYEEKYIAKYLTDKYGALHSSVTLCGQLGIEKNQLISKSLIGIANPSGQTETCCVSAVEFSASGVAVVSGAYYALLNTVKHKITGLLGKNVSDLSANIINLLSNPEFAVKLGESGRMYVKDEFSFGSVTPQWVGLFRAVILNQGVNKPSSKVKNFFKHKKYLRIINAYIQFALPKFIQWPSIYHIESGVGSSLRKIIPNIKKIIKKFPPLYNALLKLYCFLNPKIRKIKLAQKAEEKALAEALASALPKRSISFIQVGSNDGVSSDPLRKYIKRYKWRGILIEPVPWIFKKLNSLYSKNQDVITLMVAISDNSNELKKFFSVSPRACDLPGIPSWCGQLASFERKNIENAFDGRLVDYIEEIDVKIKTLDDCINEHKVKFIDGIDLLHIDAEGYDFKVLKTLDFEKHQPTIILVEHKNLSSLERESMLNFLIDKSYIVKKFKYDFLALYRSR